MRKTIVVFEKIQLEFRGGCSKATTAVTHLTFILCQRGFEVMFLCKTKNQLLG